MANPVQSKWTEVDTDLQASVCSLLIDNAQNLEICFGSFNILAVQHSSIKQRQSIFIFKFLKIFKVYLFIFYKFI